MNLKFLNIILFGIFFQLLSVVPFLFFHKSSRGISNKLLGLFVIAKAIFITNYLSFRFYDYTFSYFPHSFYFGTSFTILWGPTLYLYIRSLTEKEFKFLYTDILHVLPFITHFLILTFTFHIYTADAKREIMNNGGLFSGKTMHYFYTFLHLYSLPYIIAALFSIRNLQHKLKNSFSSTQSINLSWIVFILAGFLVKWSCDMCVNMVEYGTLVSQVALISSRISLLLFINLLIYKGLTQPYIFLGKLYDLKSPKQSLSKSSREIYQQKLLNYFEKEKPYLHPDLSLDQLSKMVSIPPRSLTIVINENFEQNFYDFINSYRVKESTRILQQNSSKHKTVLEVLYEAGFNNKSSFNTAFKKYNGMTPTEFKKLQLPQVQ